MCLRCVVHRLPRLARDLAPRCATAFGRPARAAAAAAAAGLVLAATGVGAPAVRAHPAAQGDLSIAYAYRLVDTWRDVPWSLRAGQFGLVGDISSAPDGTIYVLDLQHKAVHALAADGRPLRVWGLPNLAGTAPGVQFLGDWTPKRLDVGFDGLVYVLLEGRYIANNQVKTLARVDRLSPNGGALFSFEIDVEQLQVQGTYLDLALRRDGRVYLSRTATNAFIQFNGCEPAPGEAVIVDSGVDVFTPTGQLQTTIGFREHGSVPWSLDVSAADELHVINQIPAVLFNPFCDPAPDPEPSFGDGPAQAPTRWDAGVAIFEPDHRLREIVRFYNGEDIAVGPAGVFVSRNVEIFQLRDGTPMYIGPTGGRVYAAYFGRIVHFLDAHVDGRVLSGFAHCFWQGVMMFEHPERRQDVPLFAGGTDAPHLEGPALPARVDAASDVAVLLGRYNAVGVRPQQTYMATSQLVLPQTVQRWTRHGRLISGTPEVRSQVGMCAGSRTWFTRDVAIDGTTIYSVDFGQLSRRPDDFVPAWTTFPGILPDPDAPSRLSNVTADGGKVAVLDEGTGKVHVLDSDGNAIFGWPIRADTYAVPVDIAMHGDRIYLADRGRNRILVRGIDGTDFGEWATHDGPASVVTGPTGDVFVLGRGRWAFRYSPDGKLLASWPMPDRTLWSLDIGVDDDGKVYVGYVKPEADPGIDTLPSYVTNQFKILDSGVWVFDAEPYEPKDVPPPAPDACVGTPDKWAAPRRIPLGATVGVTLTVHGHCPGKQEQVQLALVFDTSRSMSFVDALDRAKDATAALLGELDPRTAEVALATFDDGATLEQPLTSDIGLVRSLVAGLDANGDTRSTAGLTTAIRELQGVRKKTTHRQIVLLVSDGVLKDDPAAEADAARAAGIEIYALILPTNEYQPINRDQILALTGSADHIFTEPDPTEVVTLARGMTRYRPEPGLWESITIVDVIPRNMRYVAGSAVPPAAFDATANTLTWTLGNVLADASITLQYRLEPLEIGIWPTNVEATARYRDALGNDGRLIFPIPVVEVYGFKPERHIVYLPFGAVRTCTPVDKPLDVVMVLDTSSSMLEPAATGGGTKLDAARAAAGAFLAQLSYDRDRAAVVAFNIGAEEAVALTDDFGRLQAGLAGLTSRQGTRIDLGLAQGVATLAAGGRATAKPVVILLTDGLQNVERAPNSAVLAQGDALKARGALVYTIGLGNEIDADLLGLVATSPDRFYRSPTTDDLAAIYAQISERITCDLGAAALSGRREE